MPNKGWEIFEEIHLPVYCELCNMEAVKGSTGYFVGESFFCSVCFPNGLVKGTITRD